MEDIYRRLASHYAALRLNPATADHARYMVEKYAKEHEGFKELATQEYRKMCATPLQK
jgi:hypothetical protein